MRDDIRLASFTRKWIKSANSFTGLFIFWQLAGFKQDKHSDVCTEGFLTLQLRSTRQQRLKGTEALKCPLDMD